MAPWRAASRLEVFLRNNFTEYIIIINVVIIIIIIIICVKHIRVSEFYFLYILWYRSRKQTTSGGLDVHSKPPKLAVDTWT